MLQHGVISLLKIQSSAWIALMLFMGTIYGVVTLTNQV
jgi:hypothetical protein